MKYAKIPMQISGLMTIMLMLAILTACGGNGGGSDDEPQTSKLNVSDASAVESTGKLEFLVTLSAASSENVTVEFTTQDVNALAGTDYQQSNGTISFATGEVNKVITVNIIDDTESETSEHLEMVLSNATNAEIDDNTGMGTILDDETLAASPPFDPLWGTAGVFTQAETCAGCHRASTDQDATIPSVMRFPLQDTGNDVSPSYQWRHSIMAHAFDDPYFQAKLQDEVNLVPALAGSIEDKCLTCHAPMGHTHAHQSGTGLIDDASCDLADGCYRVDIADTEMHAREGVSCTLCHQIQDLLLDDPASFSGNFTIADISDSDAFSIYGPYQNPHSGGASLMQSQSGYTPQFGSQVTTSAHCATCHTLYTPTIDVNTGTLTTSTFLEQGPFLEWQNSVFVTGGSQEQQCQDCHMPDPVTGSYTTRIAVRPNGTVNEAWPERSPFYTHSMIGGNTYILELLKNYRSVLGLENSTTEAGFEEKIAQTQEFLQNASAALTIEGMTIANSRLAVDINIINKTGHKLPTSYPSRRMWLHLDVKDANNQIIFESGAPSADGRISVDKNYLAPQCLAVSKPQDFNNTACFEPHRDTIDEPSQVAIYEAVMADTNNHITYILLNANSRLKDNRIPPQGFTDSQAQNIEPQTLPVGVANDNDFNTHNSQQGSGMDTVHYNIDIVGHTGPYTVTARLLYQAVPPAFVNSMHTDADLVNRFKVMYEAIPPTVETLASISGKTQ